MEKFFVEVSKRESRMAPTSSQTLVVTIVLVRHHHSSASNCEDRETIKSEKKGLKFH